MVTGRSVAVTIRSRLAMARSNGMYSPSSKPCAAATDQLPVASAFAPPAATALALPASQTLNRMIGRPGTWRALNVLAFVT
jgi:hypothetical protein